LGGIEGLKFQYLADDGLEHRLVALVVDAIIHGEINRVILALLRAIVLEVAGAGEEVPELYVCMCVCVCVYVRLCVYVFACVYEYI
jgi:hypothetical protein